MNEQEERFVSCSWTLHRAALAAVEAREALVERYLALHYPGIPYKLTAVDDDILKLDLVFPGMEYHRSRQLAIEINDYMQSLLEVREQTV